MDVYINYVRNLSENDLLEGKRYLIVYEIKGKRYHVEADKLKILAEDYKHFFIKPRAALDNILYKAKSSKGAIYRKTRKGYDILVMYK